MIVRNLFRPAILCLFQLCLFSIPASYAQDWYEHIRYAVNPPNVYQIKAEYREYYRTHSFVKNAQTQFYKRWLEQYEPFANEQGNVIIPGPAAVPGFQSASSGQRSSTWYEIGPWKVDYQAEGLSYAPGITRFNTLEQDPLDANIVYGGTAQAGLWKTTNNGDSWTCLTNPMLLKAIGAIGVSPHHSGLLLFGGATGIWRSTNGGLTFDTTSIVRSYYSGWEGWEIKFHPTDTNKVYLACSDGYYVSNDKGLNWTKILNGYFLEIEFHPMNPSIMYMIKRFSAQKCQFFKSTDGGATFTQITNGTPAPTSIQTTERCEIAVTPAAPDRVYLLAPGTANSNGGGLYGFYVSNDAGDSFTFNCCGTGPGGVPDSTLNPNLMTWSIKGDETGGQIWYDVALAANPFLADDVYMGGVNIWKSTNAGVNWRCSSHWVIGNNSDSYVHADIHDIKIYGNKIWVVSDGGIFLSTDTGAHFVDKTNGIQGTEFWGMSAGFRDGDVMVGGTIHNGTIIKDGSVYNGWLPNMGGDAWNGYVAFGDPSILYADFAGGNYRRIQLKHDASVRPEHDDIQVDYDGSSGIAFDPRCYNCLYIVHNDTLRYSDDGGRSWQKRGRVPVGDHSTLRISFSHPEVLYACNAENNPIAVYRSMDGGRSWTSISAGLTGSWPLPRVNAIAVDDRNPAIVWIIRDGFHTAQKVFKSTNYGNTWSDYSGSLPSDNVYSIVHHRGSNGGVYIGTDLGVFYRNDNYNDWIPWMDGLPPARSRGLQIMYSDGKLKNFTNGRGAWETDVVESFPPVAQIAADRLRSYCVKDTIQFTDHSAMSSNGAQWLWSFPGGIPSTSTEMNPRVNYIAPGYYSVSLTVTDQFGSSSQTLDSLIYIQNLCGGPDTVPGMSLTFDGRGSYANFPALDTVTNTITIMAWVKPYGLQTDAAPIIEQEEEPTGINFGPNNQLRTHWNGSYWWWSTGLTVDSNQWSHVALVVTPDSLTLYLNGVPSTYVDPIPQVDFHLKMRMAHDSRYWNTRYFKGELDELCIYQRSLSQEEVRRNMHLTKHVDDPGLQVYFQYNDSTNGLVYDKVGTRNASLHGEAFRKKSTGPFAGGVSELITATNVASYTFPVPGLFVKWPSVFSGLSQITASRLNWTPDTKPSCSAYFGGGHYWIFDHYYSGSNIPAADSVSIDLLNDPSGTLVSPSSYSLYTRPFNADGNTWQLSNMVSDQSGQLMHFSSSTPSHALGQMLISNSKTLRQIQLCQGDSVFAGGAWQKTAGMYYDSLHVGAGCDSVVYTEVVVHAVPPTPQITANGYVLTSSSPSGNQWLIEGNPVIGANGVSYTAPVSASYAVRVTDTYGCSVVSSPYQISISALNETLRPLPLIQIYPNPTDRNALIQADVFIHSVVVRDVFGKQVGVIVQRISETSFQIDLGKISAGLYFAELMTDKGSNPIVRKIIKTNP